MPAGLNTSHPIDSLLGRLAGDAAMDEAFRWLCWQRKHFPPNSDIWDLRYRWPEEKTRIQADLLNGRYRFQPLRRITKHNSEQIDLWSSRDTLVLRVLARVLSEVFTVSPCCTHVKGHGGAKATVRLVHDHLSRNRFVLRTDVKAFYYSIDHFLLLEQLAAVIRDRGVVNLLWQYMDRCTERGGVFYDFKRGISLGCPLSPLMGALFLRLLDERMERLGLFYVRFMDDILVLAPTHWKLRQAVRVVNQTLGQLKLEKHPDKTFIGRIEKGFDFLGYHFAPGGLSIARSTVAAFFLSVPTGFMSKSLETASPGSVSTCSVG